MRALTLVILSLAPWLVTANGFDQATFRHWVDMRTGGDGEPVYWYAVGGVFRYPSGELLMTDELPASLRDYPDSEAQLWKLPPADLAEIRSLQE